MHGPTGFKPRSMQLRCPLTCLLKLLEGKVAVQLQSKSQIFFPHKPLLFLYVGVYPIHAHPHHNRGPGAWTNLQNWVPWALPGDWRWPGLDPARWSSRRTRWRDELGVQNKDVSFRCNCAFIRKEEQCCSMLIIYYNDHFTWELQLYHYELYIHIYI